MEHDDKIEFTAFLKMFLLCIIENGGDFVKKETIVLTLRVPIETKIQLEMIANKEQRAVNSLVNKILQDYIEERKQKNRELHNYV